MCGTVSIGAVFFPESHLGHAFMPTQRPASRAVTPSSLTQRPASRSVTQPSRRPSRSQPSPSGHAPPLASIPALCRPAHMTAPTAPALLTHHALHSQSQSHATRQVRFA